MAEEVKKPDPLTLDPKPAEGVKEPHPSTAGGGETVDSTGAPPTPDVSFPAGFEPIRPLAVGAFGAVYLARERAAGRLVALKFMHRTGAPNPVEYLLAEVQALTRLNHPNIVRVYAVDFLRSNPYFTMEYLPGGSLAERLTAAGPLPPAEAAGVITAVARGVHAAHAAGVVHRNLKPRNVLFTADGIPKVSGFGLAKFQDAAARDENATTGAGPLGTPCTCPRSRFAVPMRRAPPRTCTVRRDPLPRD